MSRRIFYIYKYFSNSLWFKSSFKFTKSRNSVFQNFSNYWYCFHSSFLTVYRNKACNIPLKSYGRGATFICWNDFEIPYDFLVNFVNCAADYEGKHQFFMKFLQTAGRNDSNDTPLERYRHWKDIDEAQLFHVEHVL